MRTQASLFFASLLAKAAQLAGDSNVHDELEVAGR